MASFWLASCKGPWCRDIVRRDLLYNVSGRKYYITCDSIDKMIVCIRNCNVKATPEVSSHTHEGGDCNNNDKVLSFKVKLVEFYPLRAQCRGDSFAKWLQVTRSGITVSKAWPFGWRWFPRSTSRCRVVPIAGRTYMYVFTWSAPALVAVSRIEEVTNINGRCSCSWAGVVSSGW